MRVFLLTGAALFSCGLFTATAYLQNTVRNPYTQPATAYYEVERWPASFASPGYIRASNSGIFVESPDRIFLLTRGEIRLPDQLPPDFNGAIGSLPEAATRQKAELRHCIIVANAKGEILERWTQHDHLFAAGGRGPHRVKISPYDPDRHVWVVDDSGQQIFKFTNDGKKLVMRLGVAGVRGADETHFGGPTDLAWLPDGSFFVADGYVNSRVVKFDANGKYLTSWGTKGIGPGQFNLPHGIDVDRNRRVYVADAHNSRIQVFDESGRFLDQWPNIWRPDAVMVSADQHLWIANGATDMMLKYDLNGKLLEAWGTAGTAPGAFQAIHGFGVDSTGTFYAAEAAGGRTQKFTPKPGVEASKLVGFQQSFALATGSVLGQGPSPQTPPMVIAQQGSFMVGGTVVTNAGTFDARDPTPTPAGQTVHGDHAYVRYQIPVNARRLPLVMWHGGAQFSKSWETTPDGREGFQSIFLRRGFATYLLDQPRSGGASRTLELAARQPPPGPFGEQAMFTRFRLGMWPDLFPDVQFSRDPAALDQWWRQQVPNTAGLDEKVFVDATVALFEKIGPAVLVTHSASGLMGWRTPTRTDHVKGIVAYEPVGFVFPEGDVPAPVPSSGGDTIGIAVPLADFRKLTRLPIQLVYGDNIPAAPSPNAGLDAWRGRIEMARRFVAAVNAHGGDAELLHLPSIGVRGNTHFPFADLNNVRVADLLSGYLTRKKLDGR